MRRNRLLTIFFVVFIDMLGFGLILPLLPYYAEAYGANTIVVSLLVASYAAAQFIGAPILGRLSDRYGRRPVLLISIAGTAIGFLLLGIAEPVGHAVGGALGLSAAATDLLVVGMLFVSRILDGLTGGNITVAQAYISDVTDETNRAKGLGLIGAAFGLGFVIGPATGGLLSEWGYAVPAFAAMALATANLISVFLFLPESLTPERQAAIALHPRAPFSLQALAAAFKLPRVGPLLNIRFWFALAFSLFQTIFALYASGEPLNLSAEATGLVLAYVGVLVVFVQGFAIGRLAKRYAEKQLMFVASLLMTAGLLAWGFTPNLLALLIVIIPLSFGGAILNTVISSMLTKSVHHEDVGGTLGLSTSLESLTRVIAPTVGGVLLAYFGPLAPGLFTAAIMAWVSWYVWRRILLRPDPPLAPRMDEGQIGVPADSPVH